MASGAVILFEGDDYIGGAVNLAARLCDMAAPQEVLASADLAACFDDSVECIDIGAGGGRLRPAGRSGPGRARRRRRPPLSPGSLASGQWSSRAIRRTAAGIPTPSEAHR